MFFGRLKRDQLLGGAIHRVEIIGGGVAGIGGASGHVLKGRGI